MNRGLQKAERVARFSQAPLASQSPTAARSASWNPCKSKTTKSNPEVRLHAPASTRSAARGYSEAIRRLVTPTQRRCDGPALKQTSSRRVALGAASVKTPPAYLCASRSPK